MRRVKADCVDTSLAGSRNTPLEQSSCCRTDDPVPGSATPGIGVKLTDAAQVPFFCCPVPE